jgi:hypothetical protein
MQLFGCSTKWFEILVDSVLIVSTTCVNSVAYPLNLVVNESRLLNNHEQVLMKSAGYLMRRTGFRLRKAKRSGVAEGLGEKF